MSDAGFSDVAGQAAFEDVGLKTRFPDDRAVHLSGTVEPSIATRHRSLWKQGFGSVTAHEAQFLVDLIRHTRATTVFEVGTATGLSGVMMVDELKSKVGARFRTVDTAHDFWNDKSKASGFLLDEAYATKPMDAEVHRGQSSLDAEKILGGDKADLIFIDANHQHPWPLVDTLLTLPSLASDAIMAHHDLKLFTLQDRALGIGPKYLFDQLPDDLRIHGQGSPNIYAFHAPRDRVAFVERIAEAFMLPWTNRVPLDPALISHLIGFCEKHYPGARVREPLELGMKRFNERAG